MFLDGLPIDERSIGAAKVLKKGIVQYRDNDCMLATDGEIVYLDIVMWLATNGGALLTQGKFLENQTVHTENQLRHSSFLTLNPSFHPAPVVAPEAI
jgi:hypothetical protein